MVFVTDVMKRSLSLVKCVNKFSEKGPFLPCDRFKPAESIFEMFSLSSFGDGGLEAWAVSGRMAEVKSLS